MTALLIEIGNSRIKSAGFVNNELNRIQEFNHLGFLPDEFKNTLKTQRFKEILIASVAPSTLTNDCVDWCEAVFEMSPLELVTEPHAHGLINGYQLYSQLGVDRWLAMIAAYHLVAGPLTLVDVGTAMTIDQVDAQGKHLGGMIMPGFSMMLGALERGTTLDIKDLSIQTQRILANTTEMAVEQGCSWAMIESIKAIHKAFDGRLIITGGDGARLKEALGDEAQFIPNLVFQGMVFYLKDR